MEDYDDSLRQWVPGDDVVAHNGDPLPEDLDFFADPPEEIGEVYTAWSTLTDGKAPWGVMLRLIFAAMLGGASFLALFLLFHFVFDWSPLVSGLGAVIGSAVAGVVTIIATGFRGACTYVGEAGIARLVFKGERTDVETELLFLFEEAAELRTSQTVNYTNGVYTGTNYNFVWSSANQKKIATLQGSYHSENGTPAAKDPFCFAQAAENAWSQQYLDHAKAELEKSGAISFALTGKDKVRVGPGFIELIQGGKKDRLDADDVQEVSLHDGQFTVKRVGAKSGFLGIGKSGIFTFNYAQMANARVFLMAIDMLVGLQVN
ncbi:MAG: hypothetical protein NT069_02015 [Planctomycetota bacterium]|nr:hypothetical protein [Planctomycetota bacterium]